jgi:acetyl esterase/lipase
MQVNNPSRYIKPIFDKVDVEKDVIYDDSKKLKLDVYKPSGDTEKRRAAIIWIHGGGFTSGTKDEGIQKDMAVEFAKRGYVCMSMNYRLTTAPVRNYRDATNDAIDDASRALDWVIENKQRYEIDENFIAFGGSSAGAVTCINLCYKESISNAKWKKRNVFAVIDMAGSQLFLGKVHKNDPPCIIIHGTDDVDVPFSTSEEFAENLKSNSIEHVLYPINNANHSLTFWSNEIVDVTSKFLYKALTGKEINIEIRKMNFNATDKEYRAKQVNLIVDGKLDEWKNSDVMLLDQLKGGNSLPGKSDLTGTAMIGLNENDPNRVYVAAVITDDILQDIHPANDHFWEDDSLEIMFDLEWNSEAKGSNMTSWTLGANGKDLSPICTPENTEWKVIRDGNKFVYEAALDLTKAGSQAPEIYKSFKIKPGEFIRFEIQYNDCENGAYENQVGWTYGPPWNKKSFGKLFF